jgi:hypothetical protein
MSCIGTRRCVDPKTIRSIARQIYIIKHLAARHALATDTTDLNIIITSPSVNITTPGHSAVMVGTALNAIFVKHLVLVQFWVVMAPK